MRFRLGRRRPERSRRRTNSRSRPKWMAQHALSCSALSRRRRRKRARARTEIRYAPDANRHESDVRLLAALAWQLLRIDHRKHGTSEIGGRFHELVCAGIFKFVSGTITPEHAKTAHPDRVGAENIMAPIPDHQTPGRRQIMP